MKPDIYSYIVNEENSFQTDEVRVGDNWNWNFRNHVQLIFHLKNGVFFTGNNEWTTLTRAFKNIMEPILNLAYWTEDIEVKDVVFYIENQTGRVLSFLIKKFHDEVYVKEHNLDTLFDEITETDLDYGGVLVQKGKTPEALPLMSIAFCDQTDIMGGPIGFKMSFSPSKLRKMSEKGWGSEANGATISIEDLIVLATEQKDVQGISNQKKNETTGKNIDVYIVKGDLPEAYLKDNDNMEYYCPQVQVVGFYTDKEGKKKGVTLYRKKEVENTLKFHTCKKINGRALGRGEGEALLHPQIWTNFLTIHKTNMLAAGSKSPLVTDDPTYTQKNRIQDMENLEVTTIEEGKTIRLIPTIAPANVQLFEREVNEWYSHAQLAGAAFDPILGETPTSGTTFRGQERTVAQGRGLHDRRRGQRAKFIEEIYRDWIIPEMVREIVEGKEFLATLTADELTWVAEQLADNYVNDQQAEAILNMEIPLDKELLRQEFMDKFSKKGNRYLVQILADEFRGVEVRMGINIAGKQKNLAGLNDKILSIFQFVFANPPAFQQAMQIPGMAKAFQDILEYSGITMSDFGSFVSKMQGTPIQPPAEEAPALQLGAPPVEEATA